MNRVLPIAAATMLILISGGANHPVRKSPLLHSACSLTLLRVDLDEFPTRHQLTAGAGIVSMSASEEREVRFGGTDRTGHRWIVELSPLGIDGDCFVGDIDSNSLNDIVFVSYTTSNGNLPTAILDIITFDTLGAPVLFRAWGLFDITDTGVKGLCDIDKNGTTDLVVTELRSDGGRDNFDSFYVSNVYSVRDARWRKLDQVLGRKLPNLARYSLDLDWDPDVDPLPQSDPPTDGRSIPMADFSNDAPGVKGKLSAEMPRQNETGRSIRLHLTPESGAETTLEWPPGDSFYARKVVVIDDTSEGHRITVADPASLAKVLDKALRDKTRTVTTYGDSGVISKSAHSPLYLWLQ